MSKCVLSLGTNLGDTVSNTEDAVSALSLLPKTKIISQSRIYKTPAWGVTDQPDFLNCCILLETELSPNAVLGCCLGIEAAMGRKRLRRWGERIIDIDIINYEGIELHTEELWLPHRFMAQRAFVLIPMLDLFPDGICFGFDINKALDAIDDAEKAQIEAI